LNALPNGIDEWNVEMIASEHSGPARLRASRLALAGKIDAEKKVCGANCNSAAAIAWIAQGFSKQGQYTCPIPSRRNALTFICKAARSPNGSINDVAIPRATKRRQTTLNNTNRH
jgi:hypothetical protein